MTTMTAEDLLAGGQLHHHVQIPLELLGDGVAHDSGVLLQPLSVRSLQLIVKATRDEPSHTTALMIQEALVEPKLSLKQINQLPAGVARHLVQEINRLSGLTTSADELEEHVQAPLARACFILAREFGWDAGRC